MGIHQLFQPGRCVFSVELYPPKTPRGQALLKENLAGIVDFKPDFISVTCGAGASGNYSNLEICAVLLALGQRSMAHVTCVSQSRFWMPDWLRKLHKAGISNYMALRGDIPTDDANFSPQEHFPYASDLVRLIRSQNADASIGVAGYPEGHAESPDYQTSLKHQVAKIRVGANFIISQFFTQNDYFFRWRDDLYKSGVRVPVAAGLLPIFSLSQVQRFASLGKVEIMPKLKAGLERFQDRPQDSEAFGLEYLHRQTEQLLAEGVAGIHLYALNQVKPIQFVKSLLKNSVSPLPAPIAAGDIS